MKVLIIGNLGYIGPVVIKHLTDSTGDSFEVYGSDIGFFLGNETSGVNFLPETKLKAQYYEDVRKFDESHLAGMDAVVYLAAISNDPMGNAFEKPTTEINHLSAVKIAGKAKQRGVKKFVFASSCSVYGLADSSARHEKSEVNPLTAYARSKVNGEIDLKPLADENFQITCLRFATACGFSPRLRLDLVLNDFIASALVNKKIEILSDGKPWRPLIDVKDMARAIQWGITRTGDNYLVINAGSNEWNFQVVDLAKAVQKVIPGIDISVNEKAQPDNRSYKVDFSLFKQLAPAFYPQCSLEKTIGEIYTGLTEINFSDKNFRNSKLIRLKILNGLLEKNIIDKNLSLINK